MTIYDRPDVGRAPSPAVCLAACLILAMVLALLPAPAAQTIRRMAHAALRPGLLAATNVRHAAGGTLALLGNLGAGTRRAAKLEEELDQTRRRAAQLDFSKR